MQLGPMSEIFRACAAVHPVQTLQRRRLLHQQRSLRRRPAPAGRVHLLADLRRGRARRLRRHGGAPSRSRRRQSRPDAGRGRRARRGHHHPAVRYTYRARLERRAAASGSSRPTCACRRRPSATSTPSSPPTRSAPSACVSSAARYGAETVVRAAMARADRLFGAPLPRGAGRDPGRHLSRRGRGRRRRALRHAAHRQGRRHHRGRQHRGRLRRHLRAGDAATSTAPGPRPSPRRSRPSSRRSRAPTSPSTRASSGRSR